MSKRRDLSDQEKADLLKSYDDLPQITNQRDDAKKLGISQPLLCKLLKNRNEIEKSLMNNENISRKRKRCGKDEDVEEALKQWFTKVRKQDARVNGPFLKLQAEKLALKMGKNFNATDGWLHRWKKRENLVYCKPHGESREADLGSATLWFENVWPKFTQEYAPENIFNADESGLYYRALPEHTYAFKSENAKGVKIAKVRVTVMLCCNMTGEKRKLLVIGSSKNPRCLKGVKKLPVTYTANKTAWMTSVIFSDWLTSWDAELKNRKILLLIDNCTAHSPLPILKNIKVVFLPANTTSIMQPCDQGIIRTFKAYYRSRMRGRILQEIDASDFDANEIAKTISVLDALHFAAESWGKVSEATIQNCWRKGGFSKEPENTDEETIPVPVNLSPEVFEEWNQIDKNIQTSSELTDDDICSTIVNQDEDFDNELYDDDNDCEEVYKQKPTTKEMYDALDVLRRGVTHCAENFDLHYKYEHFITSIIENNKHQTTIDQYFKKK